MIIIWQSGVGFQGYLRLLFNADAAGGFSPFGISCGFGDIHIYKGRSGKTQIKPMTRKNGIFTQIGLFKMKLPRIAAKIT